MKTQIKLFQFYTFPDCGGTLDLSGIWETIGIHNMDSKNCTWEIIRRYTRSNDSPIDKLERLPDFIISNYGHRVKREDLFGVARD